jgi:hypothetical protein
VASAIDGMQATSDPRAGGKLNRHLDDQEAVYAKVLLAKEFLEREATAEKHPRTLLR